MVLLHKMEHIPRNTHYKQISYLCIHEIMYNELVISTSLHSVANWLVTLLAPYSYKLSSLYIQPAKHVCEEKVLYTLAILKLICHQSNLMVKITSPSWQCFEQPGKPAHHISVTGRNKSWCNLPINTIYCNLWYIYIQ